MVAVGKSRPCHRRTALKICTSSLRSLWNHSDDTMLGRSYDGRAGADWRMNPKQLDYGWFAAAARAPLVVSRTHLP